MIFYKCSHFVLLVLNILSIASFSLVLITHSVWKDKNIVLDGQQKALNFDLQIWLIGFFSSLFVCWCVFLETHFHFVYHTDIKFSLHTCLHFPSGRITSLSHHTQLRFYQSLFTYSKTLWVVGELLYSQSLERAIMCTFLREEVSDSLKKKGCFGSDFTVA